MNLQGSVQSNSGAIVLNNGSIVGDFFRTIGDNIPNIIDLAFGLGTAAWIFYMIKIPWGLFFKARKGRIDGEENKMAGIAQDEQTISNLHTIENRLLLASISVHVFSALGVYSISYLSTGKWIRPHTALLFLGSAILRPAWESHFHMRTRIEQLIKRIQYPKSYVGKLLYDVSDIQNQDKLHELNIKSTKEQQESNVSDFKSKQQRNIAAVMENHTKDTKQITDKQQQQNNALQGQLQTLERNIKEIDTITKKSSEKSTLYYEKLEQEFKDALSKIAADKKTIEGLKSFMQLMRDNNNTNK